MLSKLTSTRDKIKTDDMVRHGLMMVAFGLVTALLNYLYQFSMGILLTPEQFGTLYTLLSIFMIISGISRIFQTSVTKFTSKFKALNNLGGIKYLWKLLLRRAFLLGILAFLVLASFIPLISRFLNIDNNWYLLILFLSFVLALIVPVNYGVLRGMQRFLALGLSTTLLAFLKFSFGILLVYLGLKIYGGLLSLPLAYLIVFLITLSLLKDLPASSSERVEVTGLGSYTGLTFLAISAYAVLTSVDVILAKHYLGPVSAGNYSAISLLGRVVRFAPAGIAMTMFPKTSELFETGKGHLSTLAKATLLTLLLSGGVLVLYWLFPEFITNFLLRGKYVFAPDYLLKYGLAMLFFSLSWLLMSYFLSINKTKVAYPMLGVMLLQISLIHLLHSGISQIIDVMLICGALSVVLILPFFLRGEGKPNQKQRETDCIRAKG